VSDKIKRYPMEHLNVGLIGTGFMGRVHSLAYSALPVYFWPVPVMPKKRIVADVSEDLARDAGERFGYEKWCVGWQDVVGDERVDVVDIVTPNDTHKPIALAAAKAGKHIICEKPLALNAKEAKEMYEAVEKAGVKHMVGFNYRKTPAVIFAKQLIEEGKIGKVYHFRGFYLQDWPVDPDAPLSWRFKASKAGSGSLGDLASHVIDMARYLVGDFKKVMAVTETFVKERPLPTSAYDALARKVSPSKMAKDRVDVDDMAGFFIEFSNGVKGSIEATRFAYGHNNYLAFEINGSKGSLYFNWERNNELKYYSTEEHHTTQGYRVNRAHCRKELVFWMCLFLVPGEDVLGYRSSATRYLF